MRRRIPVACGAALTLLAAARSASADDPRSEQLIKADVGTPAGMPWWVIAAAGAVLVLVAVAIVSVRRSRRRDDWTELKR